MSTQSTNITLDQFRDRQRAIWSAGDYASLTEHIAEVGERVVARAGVGPGTRLLDVACGTGNAAIPAARAGARVTGLDLVGDLLAAGREKATAEGLGIEWIEGDAESLPFEDGSFDCVVSTFGHMFAPRHRRVADEMVRVCRPDATIGICTWTAEGTVGQMLRASGRHMPPPPDFASPPVLWGAEDHVRENFPDAREFEFERHVVVIEAESIDAWADYFMDTFGPLVTARRMLGDRFDELRGEILAIWRDANEATDGTFRLPQEYLLSIIRL